jgi:hypothetical protein
MCDGNFGRHLRFSKLLKGKSFTTTLEFECKSCITIIHRQKNQKTFITDFEVTSGFSKDPSKFEVYCGLVHLPDLDTDLDCGFSVYFTGYIDFNWIVSFA